MSSSVIKDLLWPPQPGSSPHVTQLVAELIAEIGAALPAQGGNVVLIELGDRGVEELIRLAERLAEHWQGQNLSCVVVDCHPARAFTTALFEGDPEGFTEMLQYGVSPFRLARIRDGIAGHWIPAGAPWSLPLDPPEEPRRSIRRLANAADRVLLLASAADEEGLLSELRDSASFRLVLKEMPGQVAGEPSSPVPAAAEIPAPSVPRPELSIPPPKPVSAEPPDLRPEPPAAEPAVLRPEAPRSEPSEEFSLDEEDRGGRRRFIWLIPALLLLLAALYWRYQSGTRVPEGPLVAREANQPLVHLPEESRSPYGGVALEPQATSDREAEGSASTAVDQVGAGQAHGGADSMAAPAQAEPAGIEAAGQASETGKAAGIEAAGQASEAGKAAGIEAAGQTSKAGMAAGKRAPALPPSVAPDAARRRYESRETWTSVLDHTGGFLVHVESYRDSALAAAGARERGFDRAGFKVIPSRVRDSLWYRLCVGPFGDLAGAAAFRDSLLDRTPEDYCVIDCDIAH